jgi:IMP dehydrogenase
MAPESLPDSAGTPAQSRRITIEDAFAFDDVLLVPAYSAVLPHRPTPAPG